MEPCLAVWYRVRLPPCGHVSQHNYSSALQWSGLKVKWKWLTWPEDPNFVLVQGLFVFLPQALIVWQVAGWFVNGDTDCHSSVQHIRGGTKIYRVIQELNSLNIWACKHNNNWLNISLLFKCQHFITIPKCKLLSISSTCDYTLSKSKGVSDKFSLTQHEHIRHS